MRKKIIAAARRVVVKVGSNVLCGGGEGIDEQFVSELAAQMVSLMRSGREMILVTSGAISAGLSRTRGARRPKLLPELQAAAAVGQSRLMHLYASRFHSLGVEVAQILLTADDLKARNRHLNARNTIVTLLGKGILPIINENDTVSTDEIKFGDNDSLSALVSNLVKADMLVILSDIDGLMTSDPRRGPGELISEVSVIGPGIEALAGAAGTDKGTGGMASKLRAVKIVARSGEGAIIANGRERDVLKRIFSGEPLGTFFQPGKGKLRGRKRWIAFFVKPKGTLFVDDGAAAALLGKGKSLLPSGIREVAGDFKNGDTVSISTIDNREIGRGLTNFSSVELRKIRGCKTSEIKGILGRKDYDEAVHRDNLCCYEDPGIDKGESYECRIRRKEIR